MSNNSLVTEPKYFKIKESDTVLQHDRNGWTRWDFRDGIVPTSIDWEAHKESLVEITKQEAIDLMK